jgi:hypothetical protein
MSHHRNVRSFYRRAIFKRRGPLSSAGISEKKTGWGAQPARVSIIIQGKADMDRIYRNVG